MRLVGIKNYNKPEISPYLQANELACWQMVEEDRSFLDQRQRTLLQHRGQPEFPVCTISTCPQVLWFCFIDEEQ